ncbi:hypothetical protein QBC44DRAFT_362053 [Cladorrhinum sp. PSN332]|nr:hypothetical protein QBC44DRAFT_362053 [Cladorrhinum sp. PSN332]
MLQRRATRDFLVLRFCWVTPLLILLLLSHQYEQSEGVFASSFNEAGTLAQIAYTCQDGSVPPAITGATARDLLSRVLDCPNRCGGVSLANNARCGFGVLIAANADAENCFSGAIDKAPEQSTPSVKASVGTFVHRACRTDQGGNSRALTGGSAQASNMTVESCLEQARGFRYVGVEYSTECFWGNEISSSSSVAAADQCNMPCGGNPLDICGGGNHINIYENATWTEPPEPTPEPVLVPSVDNYENVGCYFDTTSARVLRADEISDASSDGMTVEKCTKYAQDNYWRYAGVQFGSQCFVGNTLRGAEEAPQRDSNMACAGNSLQTCGSGNRIQVYEDKTWKDPSQEEMAKMISDYYHAVHEALDSLHEIEDLLQQLEALEGSRVGSARARRDPGQSTGVRQLLESANGVFRNRIRVVEQFEMPTIQAGARYQRIDMDAPGGVTNAQWRAFVDGVKNTGPQFRRAQAAVERFFQTATMEASEVIVVVKASALAFGTSVPLTISVPVVGVGVISVIVKFYQDVQGVATSPTLVVPTPPSPTATPSESAAIPTPVVLLMRLGSTQSDYSSVVEEITKEKGNTILSQINSPKGKFRSLTALLTQKVITSLMQNPKVATMSQRAQADPGVSTTGGPATRRKRSRTDSSVTDTTERLADRLSKRSWIPPAGFGSYSISGELWDSGARSMHRENPRQLAWLTAPWAMRQAPRTAGRAFYDFKPHLFDSQAPTSRRVTAYALDFAAKLDHQEFEGRIRSFDATATVPDPATGGARRPESARQAPESDAGQHGTCMASCAGGRWAGSFKQASLVSVKLSPRNNLPYLDDVLYAFDLITRDMETLSNDYGVLSMSFGFLLSDMQLRAGQTAYDPFEHLMSRAFLADNRLVAVVSTGNYGDQNEVLTERTPRRNGGRGTPLIVIGNANLDGSRYSQSTYLDPDNRGILTAYAMGVKVECATTNNDAAYLLNTGSSPATALVAGYVSMMLARGAWDHANAKANLIQEAEDFKGTAWVSDNPDDPSSYPAKPRVAVGSGLVSCAPMPNPLPPAAAPTYRDFDDPDYWHSDGDEMRSTALTALLPEDDEVPPCVGVGTGIGAPPAPPVVPGPDGEQPQQPFPAPAP